MDEHGPQDTQAAGPEAHPPAAPGPAATSAMQPSDDEPPQVTVAPELRAGQGLRLLGAFVLLPWLIGYGAIGVWAVTFGARTAMAGHATVDAGYSRMVTPGGVILVGCLLVAAFAVLLLTGLLVLYNHRGRKAWTAVAVAAAILTAGAVWAGVRGELSPILWVLFFFGLVYALALAVAGVWRASRSPGHEKVLRP
jgi:hypothetical protein